MGGRGEGECVGVFWVCLGCFECVLVCLCVFWGVLVCLSVFVCV